MNLIKNFTKLEALIVTSSQHPQCGNTVRLTQRAGSMYLQFDMTPAQALELATALTQHADEIEGAA